ncbi:MAG: hypothetical protein KJP17_08440 [Gammaproteobacteria bacterium]|nr:hypothetical protein [Gammaproteobacteria bacterium]
MKQNRLNVWSVLVPGWLLLAYLVVAQAIPAFDYDLGVAMGTQDPVEAITRVGVAFWYGFAFGDLTVYIPLLAAGLIGFARNSLWGRVLLAAALGITVYWPVVVLAAAVDARGAPGWLIDESGYWVVLPAIGLWGIWGLWRTIAGDAHEVAAPHE